MIIVRLYGGLGNQLFQYAAAYAVAKRLKCDIKLDTSFYNKQSLRKFALCKMKVSINYASRKDLVQFRIVRKLSQKTFQRLNIFPNKKESYITENSNFIFDKRLMSCSGPVYIDGYWQNLTYIQHIRSDLNIMYSPRLPLSHKYSRYLKLIKTSQSVCLHVRRGDYIKNKETRDLHFLCDKDYYERSVDVVNRKLKLPVYFIFSDDIDWCKQNLNFIGKKIFIEDLNNVGEEFDLMKSCNSHIISNSSFSWWPCWLADRDKSSVIVFPKKWINGLEENPNLYFSDKIIRT